MRSSLRIAAGLLAAAITFSSSPAWARSAEGNAFQSCGKWVLKLRDFGKLKLRDYNSYVPENFQDPNSPNLKPSFLFIFGADTYTMTFTYPDTQGDLIMRSVTGSYKQKGKKLKFQVDMNGISVLRDVFADLSENVLFGERDLITEMPFVNIDWSQMKFKGRLKKTSFKAKFKTDFHYDIRFDNNSELPDSFGAEGTFKLRSRDGDCN